MVFLEQKDYMDILSSRENIDRRRYKEWLTSQRMSMSTDIGSLALLATTGGILSTIEAYTPEQPINPEYIAPEVWVDTRTLGGNALHNVVQLPSRPSVGDMAEASLTRNAA